MSDEVDKANKLSEIILSASIQNLHNRSAALKPNGQCYYCEEPISKGRLFCDRSCRDEYDDEESRLRLCGLKI